MKCEFCKKEFKREKSFANHTCKQKQRYMNKDNKYFSIGYNIFAYYNKRSFKKTTNLDHFINSQFYDDFLKIGRYINDINFSNYLLYIDFLIKHQKPIKDWNKDETLFLYVTEMIKNEDPEVSLERTLIVIGKETKAMNISIHEFFIKVNAVRLTDLILQGKISPWVLLLCDSGISALDKLSENQMTSLSKILNPYFWSIRMKDKKITEIIKNTLKEYNF